MRLNELQKPIQIKIFNDDEIVELLHKNPNKDIFKTKRIKYLVSDSIRHELHFTALEGDKIVGVLGIEKNPHTTESIYWIKHVSVDPKYSGQGISRKLIEEVFKWANKTSVALQRSTYTKIGKERLASAFADMVRKYPDVNFIEPKDEKIF